MCHWQIGRKIYISVWTPSSLLSNWEVLAVTLLQELRCDFLKAKHWRSLELGLLRRRERSGQGCMTEKVAKVIREMVDGLKLDHWQDRQWSC